MVNNLDKVYVVILDFLKHCDQDMLLVIDEGLLSDYTTALTPLVVIRELGACAIVAAKAQSHETLLQQSCKGILIAILNQDVFSGGRAKGICGAILLTAAASASF